MYEIKIVGIEEIRLNPFQPRQNFDEEELQALAQSIQSVGLIHPPTVRQVDDDLYELISGERRLRASKLAGLSQIPVCIKRATSKESAHAALIENIQRIDLNPLEIALALKNLMEEFGYSQETLAQKVGKKRSTVANYLRLLTMPVAIQASLRDEKITMGHAKAILSLEHVDQQLALHDWILRSELSVRSAEAAAKTLSDKKSRPRLEQQEDIFLKDIESQLALKLQTRVSIQENGGKGTLNLHFYSLDDLDRLLESFK